MPPILTSIPSSAPPRTYALQVRDFSGGLNLRDDAFQVASNQVSDILDLDIQSVGGVQRRGTVRTASTSTFGTTTPWLFTSFLGNGVNQVVVGNQSAAVDKIAWYTNGAGAPTVVAFATTGPTAANWNSATMARASTANSQRLYIVRAATVVTTKFNGAALTDLVDTNGAYNNTIGSPAGGHAPISGLICNHKEYMFHGIIKEGGTTFVNRIRWSHPGEPEDYRTNDFIDVNDDTDQLTAMASWNGDLYLFKDRSTWVLTGYDPTTFALYKVADVGAVSQKAVAVSAYGLCAFDGRLGVHILDRRHGATPLWKLLNPKIADGTIPQAHIGSVTLGWLGSRLFCSVPYGSTQTNSNVSFVWDPFAGKGGCWYKYALGFFQFLEFKPAGAVSERLGTCTQNGGFFHKLEAGSTTDQYDGTTEVSFPSYFTSAWFDAGDPGLKKRWRRWSVTFDDQLPSDPLSATIYKNWETISNTTVPRSFTIVGDKAAGTALVWGAGNWGSTTWASGTAATSQHTSRIGSIGTAYSISITVSGPTAKDWGLNSMVFRYIPERIV